ncbi:MAG: hypothetical protein H7323_01815 [Frankiales bacterium]|nr:hypothetical protein [Frankiales bacterium]
MLLLVVACGADKPLTEPPTAQPAQTREPTAAPSASPSPTARPTSPPLSAFEGDPAVKGMRAYLVAAATAVNARNLQQARLLATSTAARAALHQDIYGPSLVGYYPGPNPTAVLGVQVISKTERSIPVCSPEAGILLDKRGGKPTKPLKVLGGRFRMVFESGTWKVDNASADKAVVCAGVPLQPPIA